MKKKKKFKPTKPTPAQIAAEIKALHEIKPHVRRTSAFGEDHHDAIDAQIEVLEKQLSENRIWDLYPGETATEEQQEDDAINCKQNVHDAAIDARRWLDGEYEQSPRLIDDWEELRIP